MPHQCTECGRAFPDGSKEMLSGCPDCGGNKFQFKPAGSADELDDVDDASAPDRPDTGGVADRVGRATATVRRWVSGDDGSRPDASTTSSDAPATGSDTPATATDGPTADAGTDGPAADAGTDQPTADANADAPTADPNAEAAGDDDRGYGEWPNPDGVDTGGVGKGPEARRSRSSGDDDSASEWPDATEGGDGRSDATGSTPTADADTDADPTTEPSLEPDDEDSAQATARSDVVSRDELPESPPDSGTLGPRGGAGSSPAGNGVGSADGATPAASTGEETVGDDAPTAPPTHSDDDPPQPDRGDARVASEPSTDERPDLEDLREELNDQFESIRIVEPGQYELNLMELYDREEYIISLQEDGRYVIEVPERWRDDD